MEQGRVKGLEVWPPGGGLSSPAWPPWLPFIAVTAGGSRVRTQVAEALTALATRPRGRSLSVCAGTTRSRAPRGRGSLPSAPRCERKVTGRHARGREAGALALAPPSAAEG